MLHAEIAVSPAGFAEQANASSLLMITAPSVVEPRGSNGKGHLANRFAQNQKQRYPPKILAVHLSGQAEHSKKECYFHKPHSILCLQTSSAECAACALLIPSAEDGAQRSTQQMHTAGMDHFVECLLHKNDPSVDEIREILELLTTYPNVGI